MVTTISKDLKDKVCLALEKGRDRNGLMFTSMRDISRKINEKNIGPKEVQVVIDALEESGLVKIVKKSNRQTVLEVSHNIFLKSNDLTLEKEDEKEKIAVVTPKRLLEFIEDNQIESKLSIPSKKLCDEFSCKYAQLMAALNLLQRNGSIEFVFNSGILNINVLKTSSNDLSQVKEMKYVPATVEVGDTTQEKFLDKSVEVIDALFDDIGEKLRITFEERNNLKKTVEELTRKVYDLEMKLELKEIAIKNIREDRDHYIQRAEQMQQRNNRLFAQVMELKANK